MPILLMHLKRHHLKQYVELTETQEKCYLNTVIVIYTVIFVTGYWKTDQIVTLGLFHFIGPADSYTHTLPMHCCIDWPG